MKLGTSTPKADPSGDYAFEVFAKAEGVKAGSRAALEKKALQLTGGPSSAQPPAGRNVYGWHVAEGRADIFLAYCTGAVVAQRENPGQQIVALPEPLAVGADYGLTVMTMRRRRRIGLRCSFCPATGRAFWRSTVSRRRGCSSPA